MDGLYEYPEWDPLFFFTVATLRALLSDNVPWSLDNKVSFIWHRKDDIEQGRAFLYSMVPGWIPNFFLKKVYIYTVYIYVYWKKKKIPSNWISYKTISTKTFFWGEAQKKHMFVLLFLPPEGLVTPTCPIRNPQPNYGRSLLNTMGRVRASTIVLHYITSNRVSSQLVWNVK